jgi:hypothetical protein
MLAICKFSTPKVGTYLKGKSRRMLLFLSFEKVQEMMSML